MVENKQGPRSTVSRWGAWFFGRGADEPEQKRTSKRLAAHGRVTLRWRDLLGADQELTAHLLDASDAGLAVLCECAIPTGQSVTVEGVPGASACVVRNSREEHEEFVLGLEWTSAASATVPDKTSQGRGEGAAQSVLKLPADSNPAALAGAAELCRSE